MFSLAIIKDSEYWPLSNETKISKIAPLGWKDPKQVRLTFSSKIYHKMVITYKSVDILALLMSSMDII